MPAKQPEGADRARWPGRSSKPRRGYASRPRWVRLPRALATLLLLLAGLPAGLAARQGPEPTVGIADTTPPRRPLKPLPAFFHSLLLPGWAQAKLDRKLTTALFLSWEGVTLGMSLKASRELRYLERNRPLATRTAQDSSHIAAKKQEKEDWLVLLGFNHLFAGLEAFVSSQLQDFPADVRIRVVPGGAGIGVAWPIRIR